MRFDTIRTNIVGHFYCFGCLIFVVMGVIGFYREEKMSRISGRIPSELIAGLDKKCNKKTIVILGDSRVSGWKFPVTADATVVQKIGLPGVTTFEVKRALRNYQIKKFAELYIINLGVNDLVATSMFRKDKRDLFENQIIENLMYIVKRLSTENNRVLLMTVIPPINPGIVTQVVWGDQIEGAAAKVSSAILQQKLHERVVKFDLASVFYDRNTFTWKKEYAADALHWNDLAYKAIDEKIQQLELLKN